MHSLLVQLHIRNQQFDSQIPDVWSSIHGDISHLVTHKEVCVDLDSLIC